MNLFALSWSYIKSKPLNTALNVMLLSLGIAIIAVLLLLSKQMETALTKNSRGIDLVVGAKGSPMQIILSSVFQVDYPTGNIPLSEARKLSRNRLIKNIIPMAMGDSYKGFRIIGTNYDYPDLYDAVLASGRLWKQKMETVVGTNVAKQLQLEVGDTIYSSHGLVDNALHTHDNHGYHITGIFETSNSVLDNLILSSVESVWAVHDHHAGDEDEFREEQEHDAHETQNIIAAKGLPEGDADDELTTLIIQYRSPMAAVQLPRYINQNTNMQAASPAFEIARLFSLIGVGVSMVQGLAGIIIFIAALSIFIALYNALKERKYDLAIMRSLGASKAKLFTHVIVEGVLITTAGCLLGLLLGQAAILILSESLTQTDQLGITANTFTYEQLYLIAGSIAVGVIASLLPAIQAYQTDISDTLSQK